MAVSLLGCGRGSGSGVGGAGGDPSIASVKLLLGFEGSNGSTGAPGMTDESPSARGTGSVGGAAAISTTQAKFGSSSLSTNGVNNTELFFADSADFNLAAGLFTIEMFIYPNTVTGTHFLCGQWLAAPNLGWIIYTSGANLAWNVSTTGTDNLNDLLGGTITTGSWQHVCVDYDGIKYRAYVDGTMVASSSTTRTINNSGLALSIGANSAASGGFVYNGFIDELRLTKGVARYATDTSFTVPTVAFSRI